MPDHKYTDTLADLKSDHLIMCEFLELISEEPFFAKHRPGNNAYKAVEILEKFKYNKK